MGNKNYRDVNATQKVTPENMARYHMEMAAPEMYEALRTIVEALHNNEPERAYRVATTNGLQALSKAVGKSC